MSTEPPDFMQWCDIERGRRMAALAKEMGMDIRFDETLGVVQFAGRRIVRPKGKGALRSSETNLSRFWRKWEKLDKKGTP